MQIPFVHEVDRQRWCNSIDAEIDCIFIIYVKCYKPLFKAQIEKSRMMRRMGPTKYPKGTSLNPRRNSAYISKIFLDYPLSITRKLHRAPMHQRKLNLQSKWDPRRYHPMICQDTHRGEAIVMITRVCCVWDTSACLAELNSTPGEVVSWAVSPSPVTEQGVQLLGPSFWVLRGLGF